MPPRSLKVSRIGNSRGVRLPAETLKRYRIADSVVMEERSDGILLRPDGPAHAKLSWEETAEAMAASAEEWSDWDATRSDGLEAIPWEGPAPRRVAEQSRPYRRSTRKGKPA